jgi:hypothetical protein
MDAKQLEIHGRRIKLSAEAHRECSSLDTQIPEGERTEAITSGDQRDVAKIKLLALRQRQRELRC